ncbi:sce7726 family protein [Empedobacter brevis]|uniref:Sce7726 family protein n=1 Tax=Empedobacter brevis TaxID=247 RepID=A0AAJ1QGG6_9FLAO|nr:sce7726 family protein [Empedobacter brevis]MDM1073636.1 sce7726 family protein [Empedobacter brevis]
MNDFAIRQELKESILSKYIEDDDSLVLDEYNLSLGIVRADIAVVNGVLHGYEIKSEKDSLIRLENQMLEYNKFFEYVTIVSCTKFINKIIDISPSHCGVISAEMINNKVVLKTIRKAKKNYNLDKISLVKALWREEMIDLLEDMNYKRGFKSKSKPLLYEILISEFTKKQLVDIVKCKLKNRVNWKVD